MVASGRCTRFRDDGTPCEQPTDHADGWCRHPDCPGHLRRSTSSAPPPPEPGRPPRPPRPRVGRPSAASPTPVDLAQLDDLRLTQRAVDQFLFHHGGDREAACVELRTMVEDFTLRTAGDEQDGYLTLGQQGFLVVVSPARDAVVGYSTVHRERTWSQVKAGVPSRIRAERTGVRRAARPPAPVDADPVVLDPPERILDLIDVDGVRLTGSALGRGEAMLRARGEAGDAAEHLRHTLRADLAGGPSVERTENGVHLVHGASATWILSPGLRALIGARPV